MNRAIIGHLDLRVKLLQLLSAGKLAHACLFTGSSGIGKKLVALELAKSAFCENINTDKSACDQCPGCKLFDAGNHPDFHLLECQSSSFTAETARQFLSSISLKPFKAGKRVVVLNDADNMSTIVANLLLKTLEEPRKDTLFILITSNHSRLPLPVVSRCQVWRFSNLGAREIQQIVAIHADGSIIESVSEFCDGSLEQMESLIKDSNSFRQLDNKIRQIIDGDSFLALSLSADLNKDKANIKLKLSVIRAILKKHLSFQQNLAKKLAIAEALENLINADRLIDERNFNALNLLEITFLGLSGKMQGKSIMDIVV